MTLSTTLPSATSKAAGLGELLYRRALEAPEDLAVVDDHGQQLTFAQLHCTAILLSQSLLHEGVRREEPIGILTQAGIDQIIAQAAVIYAGATCCALDSSLPVEESRWRLANARVRILIADRALAGHGLRDLALQIVSVPGMVRHPTQAQVLQLAPQPSGVDHRSHLMHTSGSTGRPKAVQLKARGILKLVHDRAKVPMGPGDRITHTHMVSFDVSLLETWVPLLRGATVVPLDRSLLLDAYELVQAWTRLQVTIPVLPASLLPAIVMANPKAFSHLRAVYSGGESPNQRAMRMVLEQGPPKDLFTCYGPTESSIFSLIHKVTLADLDRGQLPLGQPVGNTQVLVLDDDHNPVRPGGVGEICLGGDGTSLGYLNQPEKTATCFFSIHLGENSSSRFYVTGDLVRMDNEYHLFFVGRRDQQVKIRGFRVEPEGIEHELINTGNVEAAAVCKVQPDEENPMSARLVAFVTLGSDRSRGEEAATLLRTRLPSYMVPQLAVCTTLPLNRHGKVDRKKLVADFLRHERPRQASRQQLGAVAVGSAADATSVLDQMKQVWHAVLENYRICIQDTDDFFRLGGTSLQAVLLQIRIKREFGVRVPASTLYLKSTLADMASCVSGGPSALDNALCVAASNQAYRADVRLYESLGLRSWTGGPPTPWHRPDEGRILLTGATGFLGAFVLPELLQSPDTKEVVCLVRGADDEDARTRLLKAQIKYGFDPRAPSYRKLTVIEGDLEDPALGLGPQRWESLAQTVSAIFHVAAHVNYAHPYALHRGANVIGTANMLRLQRGGRPKRLHYVSTMSVYGPTGLVDGKTRVHEDVHPNEALETVQFDSGYTQSKWVAEKLVYDAMEHGFPVTIYRPGAVFCHSESGIGNPSDFIARLMASSIRMRCFPRMMHQSKELVPVDYVVNAILHISRQDRGQDRAYNIIPKMTKPPDTEMMDTFHLLEEASGLRLKPLSYHEWLRRLRAQDDTDPLKPLLPNLEEEVFDGRSRWEMYENMPLYETRNLEAALQTQPDLLPCPPLTSELLRRFLRHHKIV